MDDYRYSFSIAGKEVATLRKKELQKISKKLKSLPTEEINGEMHWVAHDIHTAKDILNTLRETDRLIESNVVQAITRSLFIGLFSAYDSFIGNLLKAIYFENESLFKGIRREISLSDLLEFPTLDSVKIDMLEKEIDSFRRESYITQFEELENKFSIKTLKNFEEWPEFVEMSQRRNLFTHNDGHVSQQYLTICEREKYKFEIPVKLNDKLELKPDYFYRAVFIIGKIGFMLTHTLWRKVVPGKVNQANDAMNNSIFLLLLRKRWKTAAEFGIFGLAEPQIRNIEDISKKIRVINTAIGLKMSGNEKGAFELIDKTDWSACLREFRLAIAVLKENYGEAGQIMKQIGKSGELIEQLDYHDWPLFENFRDKPEFLEAYEKIYGISFLEKVSQDVKKHQERLEDELPSDAKSSESIVKALPSSSKKVKKHTKSARESVAKK